MTLTLKNDLDRTVYGVNASLRSGVLVEHDTCNIAAGVTANSVGR